MAADTNSDGNRDGNQSPSWKESLYRWVYFFLFLHFYFKLKTIRKQETAFEPLSFRDHLLKGYLRIRLFLSIHFFVYFRFGRGEVVRIKKKLLDHPIKRVIVMPIYDRPDYLIQTIESLKKSKLKETALIMVDDGSDNTTVMDDCDMPITCVKIYKSKNRGMWDSLVIGFDYALKEFQPLECLITMDSDTLHKPDWLEKIIELQEKFPEAVLSGFNTASHVVLKTENDHVLKDSLGGINLVFKKDLYSRYRNLILVYKRLWDWRIMYYNHVYDIPMIATRPSVIQHIGRRGENAYDHFVQASDF